MKSARATKTLSYVTKSRTNNRRWMQQGVGEEDGHRRRDARSGRGGNRVRSQPPNHSAFSSHTPPSRPHYTTADRIHCPTRSPVGSHRPEACGVAVIRTKLSQYLLAAPRPRSLSLCQRVPSAPTARGLQRKLGLADRKS